MNTRISMIRRVIFCILLFSFVLMDAFTPLHTFLPPAYGGETSQNKEALIFIDEFEGGRAYVTKTGRYSVLQLNGSWHQMGRQYGALVFKNLQEFHHSIVADMEKRGLCKKQISGIYEIYSGYSLPMKELLAGMAETSGLTLEEHILLDGSFYTLPEFEFMNLPGQNENRACSGIAVSSPRTADGKLYFARNWDMTPDAMRPYLKHLACVVFNPEEGQSFANIRPIGQVYVETAFNESGVFVEMNNGGASDPGINPDGTFVVTKLFDLIHENGTLEAMVRGLQEAKLDQSSIIQVADKQRAVSVEIPTFGFRVLEQQNGALYALNNFARPTPLEWKGWVVEIPDGQYDDRQLNLDRLFASPQWQSGVTLDMVKDMMNKKIEDGGAALYMPPFGTVIQVITVPEDMVVYFLSYGYSNWGKVDLSKLFE